ncbi:hypothetical protein T484DRAFT_1814547, partial [Baffinella frigidus]
LSILLFFSGTLLSGPISGTGPDNGSNALGDNGSSGLGILAKWRELLQFAGMGLIDPFFAGTFADRHLPGGECV